jgi:hypothetical protein
VTTFYLAPVISEMSAVYPRPEAGRPAAKDVEDKIQKSEADVRSGNHVRGFWLAQEAIALAESCAGWDIGDVISTQQLVVAMLRKYDLFKEAEQIEIDMELSLEDLSDEETKRTIQDEINAHKRQTPSGLNTLNQSTRPDRSQRHSPLNQSSSIERHSLERSTKDITTGVEYGSASQTRLSQLVPSMSNVAVSSLDGYSTKEPHAPTSNDRSDARP